MVKNIILGISILLNVAVLAFVIWALVMLNQGMFSWVMTSLGTHQLCTTDFEDEQRNEAAKDWCEKMTRCNEEEDMKTVFSSTDGQLTFEYDEDWVCKEVVTGTRVDCYPFTRMSEEYDAGLDMETVYYPDITIYINNCVGNYSTAIDSENSYKFVEYLNGCNVMVTALKGSFSSEEEVKEIIR